MIIKQMRIFTGLTQKEFASAYGMPLSTLKEWERGRSAPPTYYVTALEELIDSNEVKWMPKEKSLRKLREKLGFTRAEFSRKYEIPLRTLEDWDSGKRTPPEYVEKTLIWYVKRG